MAERGRPIPTKLKHDAIVEAVVEIRFDMPAKTIPEIFFGRLAEYEPWRGIRATVNACFPNPSTAAAS